MTKLFHPTTYYVTQIRDGKVIYDDVIENTVTDEGEGWILDVAFRAEQLTGLTGFELILSTGALVETSVFAGASELADGSGYTAKSVARSTAGFTAPSGTTPVSITTPTASSHSWTASADWNGGAAIDFVALTTVGLTPNRLLTHAALGSGAGRIVLNGDTLNVTMDVQLGGS